MFPRGHVDFGAQDVRPVFEFAAPHPFEQAEILFDRPVAIGTLLTGFG